jgi:hypothetical protein
MLRTVSHIIWIGETPVSRRATPLESTAMGGELAPERELARCLSGGP